MKIYAIRDASISKERDLAWLLYYPHSRFFHIEINEGIDEWEAPLLLSSFVKRGQYSMDPDSSRLWVELRIIPPDRQNLGMILRDNGLDEYDPFRLLTLAGGRCAQDDCYIVQIREDRLPDVLRKRLQQTLVSVLPLSDPVFHGTVRADDRAVDPGSGSYTEIAHTKAGWLLLFRDGMVRTISAQTILPDDLKTGQAESLRYYRKMLSGVSLQVGGHGLQLTPGLFVSASELRQKGTPLPITTDLFRSYVQKNVIDTRAAASLLQCSRQNIQNQVQRKRLKPVLITNNTFLFLREDVLALEEQMQGK